jgi:transglutaminase/protease-like cytokinesis protein 3
MRSFYFLAVYLLFTLYSSTNVIAQQKKKTAIKKQATSKSVKYSSPVFTNEADLNKWLYQDSVTRAFSDSVQAIKDSINAAEEMKKYEEAYEKVYAQYHYPEDSLSYVDKQTKVLLKTWDNVSVDSACLLISQKFSRTLQKARAIFCWVATRIQYDWFAYRNNAVMPIHNKDEDAVRTFKYKTGVCQNYSNLFEYMCRKTGVECVTVDGWGKNFPIAINGDVDKDVNHAWNAIRIKNRWMLVDVTWANEDTSGLVDNYWFNTPPEEFIYSHLPEDSSFQLLKATITKKQFSNFPIVSSSLFKSKFDFEIPEIGNFVLTSNTFSISIPNSNKTYAIDYTLIPYNGTNAKAYNNTDQWIHTPETKITNDIKNKMLDYEVTVPSRGVWWVSVNISKTIKNQYVESISFYQTIMFKVDYK